MAKIRDRHISPGIYISLNDISRHKKVPFDSTTSLLSKNNTGGGGNEPITNLWVFGDKFPVIFA